MEPTRTGLYLGGARQGVDGDRGNDVIGGRMRHESETRGPGEREDFITCRQVYFMLREAFSLAHSKLVLVSARPPSLATLPRQ